MKYNWRNPKQNVLNCIMQIIIRDVMFFPFAARLPGNWHRKRPIWVMLMVNSLTEADIRSRGVPVLDLYLAQEAVRLGKNTGAVERVDEQCLPLNQLNFSQVSEPTDHCRIAIMAS